MRELDEILAGYLAATGCPSSVWRHGGPDGALVLHGASGGVHGAAPPLDRLPAPSAPGVPLDGPEGPRLLVSVPGARRTWLVAGPAHDDAALHGSAVFLARVVGDLMQSSLEVDHAARELAERYEEINLLYTISEILGRTVTLEEAAHTILTELSETVGTRRAAVLVHDRVTGTLQVVAALGVDPADAPPIAVDDPASVSARVFRTQHPLLVEAGESPCDAETPYRRGSMLSVPITWTTPGGPEPIGVVGLSDRRTAFTAGDQKLVAAIATQIGTAIQNSRLVRASLAQQRLQQEMLLAHDLQMKLLPSVKVVAPEALVAARVLPADSVGGDFYQLFRLGGGRAGVMIGDVSGHGYRAALIMALFMSAAAIHAQGTGDPSETLAAVLGSLGDELETTEMFVTACYAVIDRTAGTLRYANAGHPHAFVVTADGRCERLPAQHPPLGMVPSAPATTERPWSADDDMLLFFTDGISDARDRLDRRLGEEPVIDCVVRHRDRPPAEIVERVFELVDRHAGDAPRPDDLTLVIARS